MATPACHLSAETISRRLRCRNNQIAMTLSKKLFTTLFSTFVVFSFATVAHGATLNLVKGWNLVSPLAVINTDLPKFVLLPFPTEKQYYRYSSDTANNLFQKISNYYSGGDDFFYSNTAFWVYAKENTTLNLPLSYYADDFEARVEEGNFKLYKGWNLLSVRPQLLNGRVWFGDCKLTRLYSWGHTAQRWDKWPLEASPTNEMLREECIEMGREADAANAIGLGFAVKVENDCKMALRRGTGIPSIPSLPEN